MEKALTIESPPRFVGDAETQYYMMPYIYAAETMRETKRSSLPSQAFKPSVTDNHLWIVSELHGFNSTDWIKKLPSAHCLKSSGIIKIRLALEGYAKGHQFSLVGVLRRRNYLEQLDYRSKKLSLT